MSTPLISASWSFEEMQAYIYTLATRHQIPMELIDENLVIRFCTLVQTTFDIGITLAFVDQAPPEDADLQFIDTLRVLLSEHFDAFFAAMAHGRKIETNVASHG